MIDIFVNSKKKEATNEKTNFFDQLKTAFSALSVLPKEIRFENQEHGEVVILLLRRHWITNLTWVILSLFFILAPPVIFPLLSFLKVINFLPLGFQTIVFLSWYLLTFTFIFTSFLSWYFNVFIVTNKRIIDIDFYNFLYKEISSCRIEKIQDVTYQVSGTLKIFFDYGNVLIQTAGEEKNLEFELVPKPAFVVRKISELMEKESDSNV